jgi:tetratricopeptide (TPR) repeat protein
MQMGYRVTEAEVLRAEGRPLEALEAARKGLEAYYDPIHHFYKLCWSEACYAAFEAGELEQVEELLAIYEGLAPSWRTPLIVAQDARFRGRLVALRGDRDAGVELLTRAAELFRELGTPYYVGMVLVELAELGVENAAALLAEAREIFERLGAALWLERIDALERAVAV